MISRIHILKKGILSRMYFQNYHKSVFKKTDQIEKNNGQNLSKQITKEDTQKWPINILKNAQLYQSSENYN